MKILGFALLCVMLLTGVPASHAIVLAHASASVNQQMVFMTPTARGQGAPGPSNTAYEIAVMNLDGSGFRQLTNDGKFKFLPHFSPDGTKILYTKYAVGGYGSQDAVTDVAVYDLATGKETMITHDGHDIDGVWSPDGKRIAYLSPARMVAGAVVQESTIWIVDANGSSPQKVGSASGAQYGVNWGDIAWSSKDWILFVVGQNVNGCFKVRTDKIRPDGTQRTQVTDGGPNCTPMGMEGSGDADPGFSADGQIIYSSRGFPIPPAGGPASATERKLYAFSSDAWYPGKVEQDLSLPSEPSCIEGVPKGSPDGKRVLLFRICFDAGVPKGGIYLTDTAGSYRTFVAEGFGADWSPLALTLPPITIGGPIAFTLRDQAGRLQIFTENLDGSNQRQLTFEGDNGRPDWSPDGRKIAFGSIRNGKARVAVMDADGSNQRVLVEGTGTEGTGEPDWSPDGNQIALSRPGVSVDGQIWRQIWLVNADGSNLRQITQSSTFKGGPSWSPDGTQMVFILIKNPGSPTDPQPEIGIMNADGSNERILTTEDRVNVRREPDGTTTVLETANDANAPAWSPVDNRIAFWSGIEKQYGQIWVINPDGTGSTQLTEDPTHRNSDDPSWSPDGKKNLFSTGRSGRNELWIMDADGSNERKVSDIDADPFAGRASWQPHPFSIGSDLSGAFYDPAQSGQGFVVEHILVNDVPSVLASWFTYLDGKARWLFGVGAVAGNEVHIDLTISSGADFPPRFVPGSANLQAWGELVLHFDDSDHGTASWTSRYPGFNDGAMPIQRLTKPANTFEPALGRIAACHSGAWYDPAQSGHGIFVEVLGAPESRQMLAVWYAYLNGEQRWMIAQGPIVGTTATLAATITSGTGFPPAFNANDVVRAPWGSMTFTAVDADHASWQWNSSVSGFGSGSMNLTRLTSLSGHECGAVSPAADWVIGLDPAALADKLNPALLGQYDLSGALLRYDQQPQLPPLMKAAGMTEWRVGLGRWEFGTQLLPALTDGTSCLPLPPFVQAPPNTTDLDLIRVRDWFTYTDGAPVTAAMTGDDSRYQLDYVRSVLDVATAFGAEPYVDIDHMPRALATNQTPSRTNAELMGQCGITWSNRVSNVRPVDPLVFAAAVVGVVKRIVEGSGGQPGRPVRYWEFWNEPEFGYAWNPNVGDLGSYLQTAVSTLTALDAYRTQTASADGKAIRIGLGSFGLASTAATVIQQLDAPFDFVSFHSESHDDPLGVVADIETVAAARQASITHHDVELVLAEWTQSLSNSTLDPTTMDVALHHATVLALGAAAGLTHAHHAIFWDFYDQGVPGLAILNHDFSPKPAYYAYTLLAEVIGTGASRLAPTGNADGKLDGGMGAVLAAKDAGGKVRVLLINRNAAARTARIDLPAGAATPASVRVFADPKHPPIDVVPSTVIAVPGRSLVLVEL